MNLTKDEAVRLHRELWGWLSKYPRKTKDQWPGWKKHREILGYYCFCCEFTAYEDAEGDMNRDCKACPLVWPITGTCTYDFDKNNEDSDEGLFVLWVDADNRSERKRLAEQIRDLPVRTDI